MSTYRPRLRAIHGRYIRCRSGRICLFSRSASHTKPVQRLMREHSGGSIGGDGTYRPCRRLLCCRSIAIHVGFERGLLNLSKLIAASVVYTTRSSRQSVAGRLTIWSQFRKSSNAASAAGTSVASTGAGMFIRSDMIRLLLIDGLIDVFCMQINVFEAVEVKQIFSRKTAR